MPIQIHNKSYVTVSERVQEAHEQNQKISITTEFLPVPEMVVCKATVVTEKGTFVGTSAADPSKQIEKQNPYEVSETSAIGRALGFAGYGIVEGIATADEMKKATPPAEAVDRAIKVVSPAPVKDQELVCEVCGESISEKVKNYSIEHYNGKVLCMKDQKTEFKDAMDAQDAADRDKELFD